MTSAKTLDLFAETNPAFCALTLAMFCQRFQEKQKEGAELAILYLIPPICLSLELADTFNGTNKNTGFLMWIERSPKVLSGLAERINASLEITTDAVRFGVLLGLLSLEPDGRVKFQKAGMKKALPASSDNLAVGAIKRAERLGYWLSEVRSSQTIFNALGISI
ncbi:three component ABC system middle component [Microvirga makkahensis]|uniref:Uncharacterized protein n=1 Tax=Microvirga makkahensis TaxID=1128670 RepID=A0A7X3MUP7_9HYPH|nr:three component ABC system middle component [Microvirga makkahensis]MXQ13554.1 hypothetical protein [Microvirga makkahensis]